MTNKQLVKRLDAVWAKATKLVLDMADKSANQNDIRLVRAICYQLEAVYHTFKSRE